MYQNEVTRKNLKAHLNVDMQYVLMRLGHEYICYENSE